MRCRDGSTHSQGWRARVESWRHREARGGVRRVMRSLPLTVLAAATFAATAHAVHAQSAPAPSDDNAPVCLGFAFGAFTPRLDWAKAGHAPIRDSSAFPHAPSGRDWATDQAMPNDSSLYLFPSWWPVGVYIELATRRPAPGDTVSGRATALVASGRITPPVARVKAWRVPCGGARDRARDPARGDSSRERPRPHAQ